MAEQGYVGTKFRTVFIARESSTDPRAAELITWCRRFVGLGLVGQAMGNLSVRSSRGLIITPTNTDPSTVITEQLVEVVRVDQEKQQLQVIGLREPSSESMLHMAIYIARPEITAIFHGHSQPLLTAAEKLRIPVTANEQPYGTPALVNEVLTIARHAEFLIMRNHGFIALGRTCDEAGHRVETTLQRL